MQNPWSSAAWTPQPGQAQSQTQPNPSMMLNYQMFSNQAFNPATLTPAQLQQYQLWQQQYQVWQAQYGQKYMESVNAMQQTPFTPPLPTNTEPPPPPPSAGTAADVDQNFEKEYRNWENQYEKWKKENAGHPDQVQFKEYEAQWENMRRELNKRREELYRKVEASRLGNSMADNAVIVKKPILPDPPVAKMDQNFPPALSSSTVAGHRNTERNDKRFNRRPRRGGRNRGGFSGSGHDDQGYNDDGNDGFNQQGQWGSRGDNFGYNDQNFDDGDGQRNWNRGSDNRGPNFDDGNRWQRNRENENPQFRGGNNFNQAPLNNPFPDGTGNRFNERLGNWGSNNFNDGQPNRDEPKPFNDGPRNWRPNFNGEFLNRAPNAFNENDRGPNCTFNDSSNRGPNQFNDSRGNRGFNQFPDNSGFNRNFNEGNRGWVEDFTENLRRPNVNDDFGQDPFPDGPSQDRPNVVSPTLLKKIPSLLDMPLIKNPNPAEIDQIETKQLSGFVGDILAKLGVAPCDPKFDQNEPNCVDNEDVDSEPECLDSDPEPEPEPEPEWKPEVFDYTNKKPPVEIQFEVKDYGHSATKRTFEYGHGGSDRATKTFDYAHGGDRALMSFDYGHGEKNLDYVRRESSVNNDGFRRYRDRSPVRSKRSRSRSPRKTFRRDFNDYKKGFVATTVKHDVSTDLKKKPYQLTVLVEDLICAPGRSSRPSNIVIILRGISGSGKSFVTRLIKEKEIESGGAPPRILSIDDYFMVESDEEVKDTETGLKKKVMKYEYDKAMESVYEAALLKAFKKTLSDGFFQFVIVDALNKYGKDVEHMWSHAKQKGFQVYICEMDNDIGVCSKRTIHNRTELEIEAQLKDWETVTDQCLLLDVRSLLQSEAIDDVVMEDVVEDEAVKPEEICKTKESADDEDESSVSHFSKSKWDNFQSSGLKLDLLDGVRKKKTTGTTIEEYLTTDADEDWPELEANTSGKKRVRWADVEEKRQQHKMRAIGFVVGQTDWNRMMDPTMGESALTRTKYI